MSGSTLHLGVRLLPTFRSSGGACGPSLHVVVQCCLLLVVVCGDVVVLLLSELLVWCF
jgi:hypothetical protein